MEKLLEDLLITNIDKLDIQIIGEEGISKMTIKEFMEIVLPEFDEEIYKRCYIELKNGIKYHFQFEDDYVYSIQIKGGI